MNDQQVQLPSKIQEGSNAELEFALEEGLRDVVTKQAERSEYLGELRERVLRVLSLDQALSEKTYSEILTAINDPRASRVLIHHTIPIKLASKYEKPAQERGLDVTYVSDSSFRGSIGLVVSSDDAVDVEVISVPNL